MLLIHGDCLEKLKEMDENSIDAIVTDPPYGLKFMNKKWDCNVPSVEIWKEALRVLKPGGHLLSFAGTRTYHRMCCNIEDAGFEIRDMIAWIYGSGFPKSLNIGKAIDKIQGNTREITGESKNEKDFKDEGKKVKEKIGINKLSFGTIEHAKRKTIHITKGNSEYEGWGTALKPALEPVVMARKPLSEKTIVDNVLKWGTGGINIDKCRVGKSGARFNGRKVDSDIYGKYGTGKPKENYNKGRFPANLIHDGSDEVEKIFPYCKSGELKPYENKGGTAIFKLNFKTRDVYRKSSEGSASRFFYCAKANRKDRDEGLDAVPETRKCNSYSESREGMYKNRNTLQRNTHPTVKPTKLMQYLVRLVTPPEGVVLDPFMGSGSTGKACMLEGFNFIGIERELGYYIIAKRRIEDARI